MADEIVIEVKGEETPPAPESVVVVETIPPTSGTDAAVILTLEMVLAQVTESREIIATQAAALIALSSEIDSLRSRLSDMELREIEEPVVEEAEIIAEVIPPEIADAIEEAKPQARKRKFI